MPFFFCKECGYEASSWLGKCPACQNWNTFTEFKVSRNKRKRENHEEILTEKPVALSELENKTESRFMIGIHEFDNVLGGGIVAGMVVLIGGEPGIGKSTLMIQLAEALSKKNKKILYASGEESKNQIKIRAQRLGINNQNIVLHCTNKIEEIAAETREGNYDLLIVDSIQSVHFSSSDTGTGSISQLKECTASLVKIAKTSDIPVFIIGHITKEGIIAGPKIIEHMVDTVLYFEGELKNRYKILRAIKNRFGSTNELGVFEMSSGGLAEVKNPSDIFISHHYTDKGVAVSCILEGTRPFLVEVQALVTPANYGTPQRVALGVDQKKLSLLIAIIEKYLVVNLSQSDIFVKCTGGIRSIDPTLDLAVVTAVLSSFKDIYITSDSIFLGEVGLSGEVRETQQMSIRTKESEKLGFSKFYLNPAKKGANLPHQHLHPLKNINDLYRIIIEKESKNDSKT